MQCSASCCAAAARQAVCKPGSVLPAKGRPFLLDDACAASPAANPDRSRRRRPGPCGRAVPIRHCSGRGLPCLIRRRTSGALLPHLFTLTPQAGRFNLCDAIPRVSHLWKNRPGVTRRPFSLEPGLSSPLREQPSDRLTRKSMWPPMRSGSSRGVAQGADFPYDRSRDRPRVPASGA